MPGALGQGILRFGQWVTITVIISKLVVMVTGLGMLSWWYHVTKNIT
jgi:hypothetical protein